MAGKYFSGPEFAGAPKGALGCGGSPRGYVSDDAAGWCWAVTGRTIIIGDLAFSYMAGFECCNFNFRVDSTQRAVPNMLALTSPNSSVG